MFLLASRIVAAILIVHALGQVRLPFTGPSASSSLLAAEDFTHTGSIALPSGGDWSQTTQVMACDDVGEATWHCLVSQDLTPTSAAPWCPVEVALPAAEDITTDYTTSDPATFVKNWGISDSAPYDCWQGLLGATYDEDGDLLPMTLGSGDFLLDSIAWKDGLVYAFYSPGYSSYQRSWHFIVCDFDTPGGAAPGNAGLSTTCEGPFRTENGPYGEIGSSEKQIGPSRVNGYSFVGPSGEWCHGSSNMNTQQGPPSNRGVSIACHDAWPTLATTQGFGTSRGTFGRSTDLIANDVYVVSYSMDGTIQHDGTVTGDTVISTIRPPMNGDPPYVFEGFTCTDGDSPGETQVAPAEYGGNGSWTATDSAHGGAWIGGTKTGVVILGSVSDGHVWYETRGCRDFHRNSLEAFITTLEDRINMACSDCQMRFVADAYTNRVRIRFVDPGGNNQALAVSVSTNDITVSLATNGSGTITSTSTQVKAAIDAHGAASALISVDLLDGGTGVVTAFAFAPLAGGPKTCPLHDLEPVESTTGPVTTSQVPVLIVYDPACLATVNNGTEAQLYGGCSPTFIRIPNDIDSGVVFNASHKRVGGMTWDAAGSRLIIGATEADATTQLGIKKMVLHTFSVDTTAAPRPMPTVLTLALVGAMLSLGALRPRRQARA
jgi:hypothetical protein